LRAGAPRITSVLALQSESEALAINFDRRTTRLVDRATDRVLCQDHPSAESSSPSIRGDASTIPEGGFDSNRRRPEEDRGLGRGANIAARFNPFS
jgi:hypothetical protein